MDARWSGCGELSGAGRPRESFSASKSKVVQDERRWDPISVPSVSELLPEPTLPRAVTDQRCPLRYPSQVAMMSKMMQALIRGENALIESPTGSGKTLALLCAALGWQEHERDRLTAAYASATADASGPTPEPLSEPDSDEDTGDGPAAADVVHPWGVGAVASPTAATAVTVVSDGNGEDDDEFVVHKPTHRRPVVRGGFAPNKKREKRRSAKGQEAADTYVAAATIAAAAAAKADADRIKATRPPTIYFGTRTHKQITQVVSELRRTAFGAIRMCILASRETTCIHHKVSRSKDKNEQCRKLITAAGGGGCRHYYNAQALSRAQELAAGEVWDIEDLVAAGKRVKGCPYYAARELLADADIVFCPYNYLIDPEIRSQLNIGLDGAVVIVDEAHNIEDSAREAASWEHSVDEVSAAIDDMEQCAASSAKLEGLLPALVSAGRGLVDWAVGAAAQADFAGSNGRPSVGGQGAPVVLLAGEEAALALSNLHISASSIRLLRGYLDKAVGSASGASGGKGGKGGTVVDEPELEQPTVTLFRSLLVTLEHFFGDSAGASRKDDYRLVVEKKGVGTAARRRLVISIGLWCLNPAVGFGSMGSGTRSVILTSGTLSPMSSFSSELGCVFAQQLEASHVVEKRRTWVGLLGAGPRGHPITVTYKHTEQLAFQDDVGLLVLRVCNTVPHGVLVFLPSYSLLEKLAKRWSATGLWAQLQEAKTAVVLEPRGSGPDFEKVMGTFYSGIRGGGGGLYLAVARGKVSEGIDFADDNARAVVSVGIPFPNLLDQNVALKRKFNDAHGRSRGLLTGDQWYEVQAFRALNQGLGRCIRHREDWGAILVVDARFLSSARHSKYLSKWVRDRIRRFPTVDDTIASMTAFVHTMTGGDTTLSNSNTSISPAVVGTKRTPSASMATADDGTPAVDQQGAVTGQQLQEPVEFVVPASLRVAAAAVASTAFKPALGVTQPRKRKRFVDTDDDISSLDKVLVRLDDDDDTNTTSPATHTGHNTDSGESFGSSPAIICGAAPCSAETGRPVTQDACTCDPQISSGVKDKVPDSEEQLSASLLEAMVSAAERDSDRDDTVSDIPNLRSVTSKTTSELGISADTCFASAVLDSSISQDEDDTSVTAAVNNDDDDDAWSDVSAIMALASQSSTPGPRTKSSSTAFYCVCGAVVLTKSENWNITVRMEPFLAQLSRGSYPKGGDHASPSLTGTTLHEGVGVDLPPSITVTDAAKAPDGIGITMNFSNGCGYETLQCIRCGTVIGVRVLAVDSRVVADAYPGQIWLFKLQEQGS